MCRTVGLCLLIVTLIVAWCSSAVAEPKAIEPGEAKEHAGKEVVVTFEVKSTKKLPTGKIFLDSASDFMDPKNLGVSIAAAALKKFETTGIADAALYFKGKTIKVTGKIDLYEGRVYLNVSDPKQIRVVEK